LVFQAELLSWSTLLKFEPLAPARLAALGHLSLAVPPEVHEAGYGLSTLGHLVESTRLWA
jgi:hypothetical protein